MYKSKWQGGIELNSLIFSLTLIPLICMILGCYLPKGWLRNFKCLYFPLTLAKQLVNDVILNEPAFMSLHKLFHESWFNSEWYSIRLVKTFSLVGIKFWLTKRQVKVSWLLIPSPCLSLCTSFFYFSEVYSSQTGRLASLVIMRRDPVSRLLAFTFQHPYLMFL